MAFDGRVLGQAIQQGGSQIADMFFKKYQMDREKRMSEDQMALKAHYDAEARDQEFNQQKELLGLRGDIDKKHTEFQIRFSKEVENAFGSPDLAADLAKTVQGKDDHDRLSGNIALQLTRKLGQFQPLDEKDMRLLPMLSPGSQVALTTASGAIEKQMKDYEIDRQRIDQTAALYGLRRDTAEDTRGRNMDSDYSRRKDSINKAYEGVMSAQKELENLSQEKEYKQAQTLLDSGRELPPSLKSYWQKAQEREAGLKKAVGDRYATFRAESKSMAEWVEKMNGEGYVVWMPKNGKYVPHIYRGMGPDGKGAWEEVTTRGDDSEGK